MIEDRHLQRDLIRTSTPYEEKKSRSKKSRNEVNSESVGDAKVYKFTVGRE